MRLTQIIILLLIFPLLISLSACGKSPEKARKELAQMNIEYTKENFLKHTQQGDSTVVDLFLKAGMDSNSKDDNTGLTALHFAASAGHIATLQALLSAGADVNVASHIENSKLLTWMCKLECYGVTPLMLAIKNGHVDSAKVLLNKGADVNAKMKFKNPVSLSGEIDTVTPLLLALSFDFKKEKDFDEVAKMIINKGADVNTKSSFYGEPIYLASRVGHIDIVKILINKGVDVNAENDRGETALSLARKEEHTEIVKLLKDAGAKE